MKEIFKKSYLLLLLSLFFISCSTENPYGVSFRVIGFATDATGATKISVKTVSLGNPNSEFVAVGMKNNIKGSGTITDPGLVIEVRSIKVDYASPPGSIAIPYNEYPMTIAIDPGATVYQSFSILPLWTKEFILANRRAFPNYPFQINCVVTVDAITQAGDPIKDHGNFILEVTP